MAKRTILPGRTIRGAVRVPGDKSISHRYAILAALAEGTTEIENYAAGDDCRRTLACLGRLGVAVSHDAARARVVIEGAGRGGLKAPRRALDAGNSGTTLRLLAGVLAGQPFASTITGDASLRRRPMRRILDPLAQMGAEIRARQAEFPPLRIRGGPLRPIDYAPPIPSAQVKSAILLAGLFAGGVTRVAEPVPTRDHLELALEQFGARVERRDGKVGVQGPARLAGQRLDVPGDLSAAVFFLAAALLLPESSLVVSDVGLNPTRAAVLDALAAMGASIRLLNVASRHGELRGDLAVTSARLTGGVISAGAVPAMIDELPALAVLAPFTEKGIEIRDAAELRVKESDRIGALADNLQRMGAQVKEFPDGLRVESLAGGSLKGAEVDPRGDHRIAMALAVAGLRAADKTVVRNPECVDVSFPGFFDWLDRLVER